MSKNLKSRLSVLSLLSILTATLIAVPINGANAAAKAGAPCSKANSKTTIGGDRYVCTKNPIVKKAKLTWVWEGCLELNGVYNDARASLVSVTNKVVPALALIDKDIETIKSNIASNEAKAKSFDEKIIATQAKLENAKIELKAANENVVKSGAASPAGRSFQKAADSWTKAINSYELAIKNFQRTVASLRSSTNQIQEKENQKINAQQAVVLAESQVKSLLRDRKTACKPGL